MADFLISFLSVKQMTFGSATCKVQINFQVTGPRTGIDFVQVYAQNLAGNGLGQLADSVDLSITEFQYTTTIDLQSGAAYNLGLCPRSGTPDHPDDQVEGEYWETFCIGQPFVTNIGQTNLTPQVNLTSVEPATLQHANQINITWASNSMTDGKIDWGPTSNPNQHEDSIAPSHDNAGNVVYAGPFTANVPSNLAGHVILFTVRVRNNFVNPNLWGTTSTAVQSARNYHSLRDFLTASGVSLPTRLKQHLHGVSSLRAIMQI